MFYRMVQKRMFEQRPARVEEAKEVQGIEFSAERTTRTKVLGQD